jgi:hypothetical protein
LSWAYLLPSTLGISDLQAVLLAAFELCSFLLAALKPPKSAHF